MKTITTTHTVYNYDELEKKAQERALRDWCATNEYIFLPDYLAERLHELLQENDIKELNDTSKAGTKPTQVLYSLTNCQGDGAMFEGVFTWKGYTVVIKHSGNYYHAMFKNIDITDAEGEEAPKDIYDAFKKIYQDICKLLERHGYGYIEQEDSEENFIETCEANDYTFLATGEMKNE